MKNCRLFQSELKFIMRVSVIKCLILISFNSMVLARDLVGQDILEKRVSLNEQNAEIKDVLKDIERQAQVKFNYSNSIPAEKKVTIHVSSVQIKEVINILFDGNVAPQIKGKEILLKPVNRQSSTDETSLHVQGNSDFNATKITGIVTDENNEALPGVNILEKGTANGTTTDASGAFELTLTGDQPVLVFSFIGYKPTEVVVGNETSINVQLLTDVRSLEEVVVVGYGTQEKKDVTGSVSSVSPKNFKDMPISNVEQAIKGQVAGVQVLQNTGSPSAGLTVRIRGNGSITAGNDPLFVVDGFPISGGVSGQNNVPGGSNPLNSLNPADIESIDILKDASATAIYGSRGANGVVIITTKSGKAGVPRITADASVGIQSVTKKIDLLSPEELAELFIDARNNGFLINGKGDPSVPNGSRGSFNIPAIYTDPSQWRPADWQDEIFQTGIIQNYNITAAGGTDNGRYAISAGYLSNEGVVIGSSMERFSFRGNLDSKVNDKIKIGIRFNPSYTLNNQVRSDGNQFGGDAFLGMALTASPLFGPYRPDGSYENQLLLRGSGPLGSVGAIDNPVAKAREDEYRIDQGRILTNAFAEYEIIKNLTFRTSFGIDANFIKTHLFRSSQTGRNPAPPPSIASGQASSSQELNWLSENTLSYRLKLNTHDISLLGGFSAQKNDFTSVSVVGNNYPNDNVPYVSAAGIIESGKENREQWSLVSYFARVNYSLMDRYLFTATYRRDGSSRFGANNKYGSFPSAAVAWRMSEEQFLKSVRAISNLKLRASYGVSGNNNIPNYQHLANIVTNRYVLGNPQQLVNGMNANRLANQNLTWETKKSFNVGLDIGLFDNRIEFNADAYQANTDGLLLDVNIPSVSGFQRVFRNVGEVENRGLEFALSSNILTGQLTWNSSFNIALNRNKIVSLGGSSSDFIESGTALAPRISRNVVGEPLGMFYLRVTDGVFNTVEEIAAHAPQDNAPAPGDRRYKDVDGNNVVNDQDRAFSGNPNPDFTFGLTNNLTFKGFELNVLITGSYGNDVFWESLSTNLNLNGNLNQHALARERWRSPENPGHGNIPKAVVGFPTKPADANDFFVFDGSFLRISNVTLGYNLPMNFLKFGIQRARVYLSGQNIYTWTNYPGYDPETAAASPNPLLQGVDISRYPMAQTYTVGCNITF